MGFEGIEQGSMPHIFWKAVPSKRGAKETDRAVNRGSRSPLDDSGAGRAKGTSRCIAAEVG